MTDEATIHLHQPLIIEPGIPPIHCDGADDVEGYDFTEKPEESNCVPCVLHWSYHYTE